MCSYISSKCWCCKLNTLKYTEIYTLYPEKVRYKVIGVEMKGMKSSMKLVALGATQRRG